jgi:5'-phosphate synthase pdxT subunit
MAQERVGLAPVTWTLAAARPQRGGVRVGVLAVQGDFLEHQLVLDSLGAETVLVRLPQDLSDLQALILPGGESTTMAKLLDAFDLRAPLRECIASGTPVWGTCAGLIMLARELAEDRPEPLGVMDIRVSRNAYGRQVDSFETDISVPSLGEPPFHAVFIRAPAILETGPDVEVLASLPEGGPVAARQGTVLVTAFHPELTPDTRFHAYFLRMAAGQG